MKKALTIFLALVTLLALAVPASGAKGGKPGKPDKPGQAPKVTVSIEASLYQAHEVDDLIVYFIDAANNSSEAVTIEDSLTGFGPMTVAAGETASFELDYSVVAGDFIDPAVVINTVIARDGAGNVVASASDETGVSAYPECDDDLNPGDGSFSRPPGYSVCIWKPAVQGDWTFEVTPAAPNRPVTIRMNLRDDVPGNWCPFDPHIVKKWRGAPEVLTFDVNLPEIPLDWHGEAICPDGGAGGDFFGVGTPSSFYLATYDNYQITTFETPSTP